MSTMDWGHRNKAGKHTGRSYSRTEAKAKIRHNDAERRADPMVKHANREIDKSRTHLNYEIGPTKGMTYLEKCARLDARLDELGYPTDAEANASNKQRQWCMQGLVTYPPEALRGDPVKEREWFEAMAEVVTDFFGEENVIAMYVDCDEGHYYTDARTGEIRRSLDHAHMDIISACEHSIQKKKHWYLTPEGKETLSEAEAALDEVRKPRRKYDDKNHAVRDVNPATGKPAPVYLTEDDTETFEESEAAVDVTYKPRYSRDKSGRPRYKKEPKTRRYEITSDFQTIPRMTALNRKIEEMTLEKFGCKWLVKELDEPTPEDAPTAYTVEELKEQSLAKVNSEALAQATAEIEANVEASKQTLKDAEATAEVVKNEAEAEAKTIKDDAKTAAETIKTEAENIKTDAEHRQTIANEELAQAYHGYFPATDENGKETRLTIYSSPDDDAALGRWLKSLPGQLPEGCEVNVDGRRLTVAGSYVPGSKVIRYEARRDAKNALSEERAALAERERKVKAQEEKNTQDAVLNERRRHAYETAKKEYEDAAKSMDDYVAQLREEWSRITSNVVGWVANAMRHIGGWFMRQADQPGRTGEEYWRLRGTSEELHRAADTISRRPGDSTIVAACSPDAPPWETVEKPETVDTASVDAMIAAAMDAGIEDEDDTAPKKPGTAKRQGQRTTRAVTAQRLIASVEMGQSLDSIDSTPADDYGFGF